MKITIRKINDPRVGDRWVLDYTPAGGKRVRRFFRTRAAVDAAASEQQTMARRAGDDWLALTAGERADLMTGYAQIRSQGLTLMQVLEQWRTGKAAGTHGTPNTDDVLTVRAALDRWIAELTAHRSEAHVRNCTRWANRFANGLAELPITSVTSEHVKAWLQPHEGSSYNTYRNIVKSFFSWAQTNHRETGLQHNPVEGKIIPVKRVLQERPKHLTSAEAKASLEWLMANDMELLAYWVLATFCGIRPEECDRMTGWEQVDFERKVVQISNTKTGRPRTIHLEPAAAEWLQLAKQLKSRIGWETATRICRLRPLGRHLGWQGWPKDILRHSFGTYYTELHRSLDRTAMEMGNTPAVCKKHYADCSTPDAAAAFWALTPANLRIPQPAIA